MKHNCCHNKYYLRFLKCSFLRKVLLFIKHWNMNLLNVYSIDFIFILFFNIRYHKQKSHFFFSLIDIILKKSDPSLPELLHRSFHRNLQPLSTLTKILKNRNGHPYPIQSNNTSQNEELDDVWIARVERRYTIRAACTLAGCNKPLFMAGRFGRNYKNFRIKL